MNKCFSGFFFFILILHSSSAADYFVTSSFKGCTSKCKGTLDDPFDTLLFAIYSTLSLPSVTLILLYNSSAPHYIFSREISSKGSSYYAFSEGSIFKIAGSLIIRPLYCDEQLVLTNSSLLNKCIRRGQKLPVVLKWTNFTFSIQTSAMIEGIALNGIEDIKPWNSDSTELQDCLYRRKRCCEEDFNMSFLYPSKVTCQVYGNIPIPSYKISLFRLDLTGNSTRNLVVENTDLTNFFNPESYSFVLTGAPSFNIVFRRNNIDRIRFYHGLVFHATASSVKNNSSIIFEDMNFTNYNVWDIYYTGLKSSEGYLFEAQLLFSGKLTVKNSIFKNAVSSRRRECLTLDRSNYNFPMNNTFKNYPSNAASNLVNTSLWIWYNYDHSGSTTSSLIIIRAIDGPLSITDCTFKDIIGITGSVLSVSDVTSANNSFTIYNNIFHNNFAYDGFPNIRIAKKTRPYFTGMFDCPHIEIVNSTFTNATGCPGAYGNVLLLCYWFPEAYTSGLYLAEYYDNYNNYSEANFSDFIVQFRKLQRDEFTSPMFIIKNSTFRNNLLAVSNSLAIIGSYNTLLEGNIFQDNGGTTGKVGIYIFNELSSHSKRFPSIKLTENIGGGEINFGQSTTIYLDEIIKLYSKSNIYQRNWGPYEGTLSLGSSISIKRWYTYNSIKFEGDYFGEHGQIPSIFLSKLQVDGWSFYTDPIVAIGPHYYRIYASDTFNANILFKDVRIVNNIANYDLTNFRYNYDNLQDFINVLYEGTTGLIKILNLKETAYYAIKTYDETYNFDSDFPIYFKIRFAFYDSEIRNNTLLTPGCLFSSFFVDSFILDNVNIINNKILESETSLFNIQELVSSNTEKVSNGMFCTILKGVYRPVEKTALTFQNSVIKDNTAILVNTFGSKTNTIYVINSVILNNTCTSSALFQILDAACLVNLNNLMMNNYNTLGNIYLDNPGSLMTMFNTYLKNDGFYSSILLLKDQVINSTFQETFAKVYWNTVSPSSSFFSTSTIPQGGLYFINSSRITFWMNDYWQNTPYSGIVTAINSMVVYKNCEIKDHYISGLSILGSYILSSLQTFDTKLINSQIIATTEEIIGVSSGVIRLVEADAVMSNLKIIGGTAQNGALLIFGNCATISMNDIKIENFFQVDRAKTPLMHFILSEIQINSLRCSNVTSIFQLFQSKLELDSGLLENIRAFNNILYLFNVDKTDLNLRNVSYGGNREFGEFPLFTGKNSNLKLIELRISNISNRIHTVINLNDGGSLFVSNSFFGCSPEQLDTTIFDLSSINNAIIIQSTFNFVGRVVRANNLYAEFYFVSNTLLTNSHIRSILLTNTKNCYIPDNHFLGHTALSIIEQRLLTEQGVILSESQLKILDNSEKIFLKGNVFISLLGLNGIVEIIGKTFSYNVDFDKNIFIDNTASQGGAIYLEATKFSSIEVTSNTTISSSIFVKNKAINYGLLQGIGGALHLSTQDLATQSTLVVDTAFLKNSADGHGGAIFFDHSTVDISQTSIFRENKASILNDIGSKPSCLIYIEEDTVNLNFTYNPFSHQILSDIGQLKSFYKWDNLPSGLETNKTFRFALLDMFGQVVSDDSSQLTFKPQDSKQDFSSLNQITLQAQGGYYSIINPIFEYQASSKLNVTFSSTALNRFNQLIPPITIEMSFRSCGVGEFKSQKGKYIVCEKCPSGFWQLNYNTNAVSCAECETEKVICLGGEKVGPKLGYWRMNETADLVIQCPRPASCRGNYVSNQEIRQNDSISLSPIGECEEGYEGSLCSKCTPGWAKSTNSQSADCLPCEMGVSSFLLLALLIFVKVGFIVISVKGTMELAKNYSKNNQDQGQNDAVLLRIMLNYLQLVSLVAKIPVTWPNIFNEVFSTTSKVSSVSEQSFSVECFILAISKDVGIEYAFFKVFFTALTPLFFCIIGVLFWLIYFKATKKPIINSTDFINKVITTIIIICYQNQTPAIESGLSIFRCTNLYRANQPVYFLEIDYDIECWDQDHAFWILTLGIPIIFVWIIAFPGTLAFILIKNKKKLHVQKISQVYSFLYGGYKKSKFYWEFIILFRKILIMVVIILAGLHSIKLQIYIGILAIILSGVLQEINQPYSDIVLNNLEKVSLISAGIVNFTGLYFHIIPRQPVFDIIITIIGLLGYSCFLLLFIRIFLKAKVYNLMQNEKIRETIKKIFRKYQWLNQISFLKNRLQSLNQAQESKLVVENQTSNNHPLNTPTLKIEATQHDLYNLTEEKLGSPSRLISLPNDK